MQPDSLAVRLSFLEIDPETRRDLQSLRPLIARHLPAVLDDFYRHVTGYAEVARLFTDPSLMHHAKTMQLRHWDLIAAANFDSAYVESVTRVGETHRRLGLEPRWYIGGYSFLMTRLTRIIESEASKESGATAERKGRLTAAFLRAALLDMDFAISVYLDAGLRAKQDTIDRMSSSFRGVIHSVSAASQELEATASTLTETAGRTKELSGSVAAASDQTAANGQAVAAAAEELASSVGEIARQVRSSRDIAGQAVNQAKATDTRISELSQAAARIGDVIKLINAIAAQTNLLALNATIEAARAGEAGRGFAVVAQEVKALAGQTAKATGEISGQIAAIQDATRQSVVAIKEIGATISQISDISTVIAAAVEEQGATTSEIARNVQQVAAGSRDISHHIDDVRAGANETGAASTQVLAAAHELAVQGTRLNEQVDDFVATVRAA
jgi:methyl-accepting chemotaxis protein